VIKVKIGFIGLGSMAQAMIRGLIQSKQFLTNNIYVHSEHLDHHNYFIESYGINRCDTNLEVIQNTDVIVLAVGVNDVLSVLKEIRDGFKSTQLLISIAWQVSLNRLQELTDYNLPIMRIVPNLNVAVGEGVMIYCNNENVSANMNKEILSVFNLIGSMILVDENKMDVAGSLIGCSPAYAYLFADILSRSAVSYGLNKEEATQMAAQTILGSMKMIMKTQKSPNDLMDGVCSPGGSTIKGLLELKKHGFENAVINCFDATQKK
jgi:pyrroline-5-carboxylate reductase